MKRFSAIAEEARNEFDLGDKAQKLIEIIAAMIADKENGGFSGFLQTFEQAGLGDLAVSWVNAGANMPISYEQTESVYGEETLREISREAGIEYETATSAVAFITPRLIDELTPNAEAPSEDELREFTGETSDNEPRSMPAVSPKRENTSDNILQILIPLAILILLIAVGYTFCN